MKIRHADHREQIILQMTPMIDIVFQLLVFFVFTFKIVQPEGDFNIRMPSADTSQSSQPSETPLLKVRLQAAPDGSLKSVQLGDLLFDGQAPFYQLQSHIRGLVGDDAGPGSTEHEVELDCDFGLRYRYAINAWITSWSKKSVSRHSWNKCSLRPVDETAGGFALIGCGRHGCRFALSQCWRAPAFLALGEDRHLQPVDEWQNCGAKSVD